MSKIIQGKNDLFTVNPLAKKMWDFDENTVDPTTLGPSSNKEAHWICEHGHKFKRIVSVFQNTQQCPKCKIAEKSIVNQPQIMKFYDAERNPDVDPTTIVPSSLQQLWWHCPTCNYKWQSQVRTRQNGLCPCCDQGVVILPGYNDCLTVAPGLRDDYDPSLNRNNIDIHNVGPADKNNVFTWRCHKCGYVWNSTVFSRLRGCDYRNGEINMCPVCGGAKRALALSEEFPELAAKYDNTANDIKFVELTGADYNKDFWWKCSVHIRHKSSLYSMIRAIKAGSSGCPYCEKKVVFPGNSIADIFPKMMAEWDAVNNAVLNINPRDLQPSSTLSVWWVCADCGQAYLQPVNQHIDFVQRGICACPVCKGIRRNISHQMKGNT